MNSGSKSKATKVRQSNYELKKLSEWWFDLSKIAIGSLVLKLFETEGVVFGVRALFSILLGLTFFIVFATFGRNLARRVKDD